MPDSRDDLDATYPSMANVGAKPNNDGDSLARRVDDLQRQEERLKQEVATLVSKRDRLLGQQGVEAQELLGRLVQESMADLTQRRQALQLEIEQLERRKERIQAEMRTNFVGASQDLAIRVQGFKDYLVGSLQDLATAAEQLKLMPDVPPEPTVNPRTNPEAIDRGTAVTGTRSPRPLNLRPSSDRPGPSTQDSSGERSPLPERPRTQGRSQDRTEAPPNIAGTRGGLRSFSEDAKQIRQILDQYRLSPDYYGMQWQLRRTFEPIHAERVSQWFFDQNGRGALKSMGSRLQNILVASAIISVLRVMYGDRIRTLILSDAPERLGEWRRGLQDCLGISRADFGAQQGVALFEAPEALAQRADRLIERGNIPLVLIDNSEDKVHLSLLQYPLWLAFAPDMNEIPLYY